MTSYTGAALCRCTLRSVRRGGTDATHSPKSERLGLSVPESKQGSAAPELADTGCAGIVLRHLGGRTDSLLLATESTGSWQQYRVFAGVDDGPLYYQSVVQVRMSHLHPFKTLIKSAIKRLNFAWARKVRGACNWRGRKTGSSSTAPIKLRNPASAWWKR